jgi:catechol 2,3-dioxygenase-like lactoylglutathione lyase family enzyme
MAEIEFKVEVVVVPVADVDRARAFWVDTAGFPLDVDTEPVAGFRVVQVTPPGSGCSLVFGSKVSPMAPGSLKGVQICVADIDAARDLLAARGVPVSSVQHMGADGFEDGRGGDWNSFAFFDDPDGNSWVLQESPSMHEAAR